MAVVEGSKVKNRNSYVRNAKSICDSVGLMYISQKRAANTGPFLPTEEQESPSVMIRATPVQPEYQVKSTGIECSTALKEMRFLIPQVKNLYEENNSKCSRL
jgi:hypothetical protein